MAGVSRESTDRYPTFAMPALNELKIRAARPKERAYKLFDERGLFMRSSLPRAGAYGASDIGWAG